MNLSPTGITTMGLPGMPKLPKIADREAEVLPQSLFFSILHSLPLTAILAIPL
jgi:hypothetical protein